MAYDTGNSVPSTDPRDLYDNAQNLDKLVNGESSDYQDRLGKTRKSWAGMEQDFADFLAASEYEFLGDYEAGIEVTSYNQVIRDGGEFWRAAAGTELPYTTTGDGVPEGGAFVSVGDAVLRQDLADQSGEGFGTDIVGHDGGTAREAINERTIYVDTVADMVSKPLSIGAAVQTMGEDAAGDGGEKLYRIVAGGTGNADGFLYVDLDNGNQAELIRGTAISDLTVLIPAQYPDVQSAIDDLSGKVFVKQGVIVDCVWEAGHRPVGGASVRDGSYGHFQISAQDAEVTVDDTFSDNAIVSSVNGRGPVLACLVNANGVVPRGYLLYSSANGLIKPGAGVKGTTSDGMYVYHGSILDAADTIWDNATGKVARVSRASKLVAAGISAKNCTSGDECIYVNRASEAHIQLGDFTGFSGRALLYAHRGSVINGQTIAVDGCDGNVAEAARSSSIDISDNTSGTNISGRVAYTGDTMSSVNMTGSSFTASAGNTSSGLEANGGTIEAQLVTLSGFGGMGCYFRGGNHNLRAATILNSGSVGARAEDTASVDMRNAEVTGSGGADIAIDRGGIVNANNVTTTNGPGSPDIGDTNIASFNTINGRQGIIWD